MNPPTDWTTPIAILAAGLILGAIFIFYFINRRRSAPTIEVDTERRDLEAKRDALIAELRALPDDAVDERARLEMETANVLRALDRKAPLPAQRAQSKEDEAAAAAPAMNPAVKGFLWGAGSFAVLAGMLFLVYKTATPRAEGDSPTGGTGTGMASQQQQQPGAPDPMVQQMEAAVQKDPTNSQLRLDLAQMYLERDNLMGVFEQTKVVLDKEPRNPRALTFGALVRMAMGETDAATAMLQQATQADAKNLDSWVALAWVYAQTDRMPDAEKAIAQAISVSPENKGRLQDVLTQMKTQVGQAKNAPQQAAQAMPEGHPPIEGAPAAAPAAAAPAPAAAPDKSVKVTLQLAPTAKLRAGVVYVMARPLAGGPPVAVKRMSVTSFPVTFDFGAADSMMGQPLPDRFRLEARLDSDGDAATKPPTDPAALQPEVSAGAAVTLALK